VPIHELTQECPNKQGDPHGMVFSSNTNDTKGGMNEEVVKRNLTEAGLVA
jgi:hypothetical protein